MVTLASAKLQPGQSDETKEPVRQFVTRRTVHAAIESTHRKVYLYQTKGPILYIRHTDILRGNLENSQTYVNSHDHAVPFSIKTLTQLPLGLTQNFAYLKL